MLLAVVVALKQAEADGREEDDDRDDGASRLKAPEPRLTVHASTPAICRAIGLPL